MKFFLHECDSHLGLAVFDELKLLGGAGNVFYGTTLSQSSSVDSFTPSPLIKLVPKSNKRLLVRTSTSCEVSVLPLQFATDEVVDDLYIHLSNRSIDQKILIVLVSSFESWTGTRKERVGRWDWEGREAELNGERNKIWEDKFLSLNNPQVTVRVLTCGVLYGGGEGVWGSLCRDAWLGVGRVSEIVRNVPTVHVVDAAKMINQVITKTLGLESQEYESVENEEIDKEDNTSTDEPPPAYLPSPFYFAMDSAFAKMSEIVSSINSHFSKKLSHPPSAEISPFFDLRGNFKISWHCQEGPVKGVEKFAREFCKSRDLKPTRVLFFGGKGTVSLADKFAEYLKLPLLVGGVLSSADLRDIMLGKIVESHDDNSEIKKMRESARECLFRGYVLGWKDPSENELKEVFGTKSENCQSFDDQFLPQTIVQLFGSVEEEELNIFQKNGIDVVCLTAGQVNLISLKIIVERNGLIKTFTKSETFHESAQVVEGFDVSEEKWREREEKLNRLEIAADKMNGLSTKDYLMQTVMLDVIEAVKRLPENNQTEFIANYLTN